MNLCEYGCGQEANHQFKNGKWCCSKSWQQCPGKKVLLAKNFEKEKKIPIRENLAPEQVESETIIAEELKSLEPPVKIITEVDGIDVELTKTIIDEKIKILEKTECGSIITEEELKSLEPPAKIIKETIIPPTKKAVEETVPEKESIFKRIKNWFTF